MNHTARKRTGRPVLVIAVMLVAACFTPSRVTAADTSCAANAKSRALDFWLGDWSIAAPGGGPDASSKVTPDLDHCLVIERWKGGDETGVNIFGYSPDDKSWHGLFANNQGHIHVFFHGTVASDSAEFTGPNKGPDGRTILNRITIRRIDAMHVQEMWEKSRDGGKTWTTLFRLRYTRKQL